MKIEATYVRLRDGKIIRTIELNPWTLVDVDADGHILGIETLDESGQVDWPGILMSSRVTIA